MGIDQLKGKLPSSLSLPLRDLRSNDPVGLKKAGEVLAPKPAIIIPNIFTEQVSRVSNRLTGERTPGLDQKDLGAIQARNNVYPDPNADFSVVGNPFLVIPFSTQAEVASALFQKAPEGTYDLSLPPNAVAVGDDRLFKTTLRRTDKPEADQTRAVLVDSKGQLKGAECQTVADVQQLLTAAPTLSQRVFAEAFGADGFDDATTRFSLVGFTRGEEGAFTASVSNGTQVKTVELNNFGIPTGSGQPALDVLRYHLDEFVAAA